MTSVKELREWLEAEPDQSLGVGVDEGGLTLVIYKPSEYDNNNEVTKVGKMTDAYYEVGGIPEEIENA
jgi:hypothetical protein